MENFLTNESASYISMRRGGISITNKLLAAASHRFYCNIFRAYWSHSHAVARPEPVIKKC